ncbi:MAG: DUF401 family protein [Spirochaetia bacterium]|nr:DUF401 family protein [Spirochaetia bacterium]
MLWNIPVIAAIFISLGAILIADRFIKNLAVSILAGSFLLSMLSRRTITETLKIAALRIWNYDSCMLFLLIFLMITMSNQIKENNIMGLMTEALKERFSGKTLLVSVAALIGLIPMPGGALFSAPLVEACDTEHSLSSDIKTRINYWFRHMWEYWFPLYAGVIMALQITGLEFYQLFLANVSMSFIHIFAGYVCILKGLELPKVQPASGKKKPVIRYLLPIIIIIGGSFLLSGLFPALKTISKYLPLILSILAAIITTQVWKPLGSAVWKCLLIAKNTWRMVLIVAVITIYSGFIGMPLADGSYLMDIMRQELSQAGIPAILLFAILPLVSGIATGIALGFVGTSFPIIFSLLGPDPSLKSILIMVIIGYSFGQIGQLLSPVHVCNVVTNRFFNTNLFKNTLFIAKPCLFIVAGAILSASAVYWIM